MAKKQPLLASIALLSGVGVIRTARNVLIWWGSGPGGGGATIGDRDAVDNLSRALTASGFVHEVLSAPEVAGPGHRVIADLERVAGGLEAIVFVCGPLPDGSAFARFLARSPNARKIAVGVSVIAGRERYAAPFHAILSRDGSEGATFDLALAGFDADAAATAPEANAACAICFAGRQKEYGAGASLGDRARELIRDAAVAAAIPTTPFDTLLSGARAEDIRARITESRMVATTRMHGALYALALGRPVVALDQIPGGAKVTAVLRLVGWPLTLLTDGAGVDDVAAAFERALDPAIATEVAAARSRAITLSRDAVERAVAFTLANCA